MKKLLSFLLTGILILSCLTGVLADTDEMIFKTPVSNAYKGRVDGSDFIYNLNFTDVPAGHWAKEAIIRSGALDIVKGYGNTYDLNGLVTYQELIAFAVRAIGLEKEAQTAATTDAVNLPAGSTLRNHWSMGYFIVARDRGILTEAEYLDAMSANPQGLNLASSFVRTLPATREDVAYYLDKALNSQKQSTLFDNSSTQSILTFNDFDQISPSRARAVEAITERNIMVGSNGSFRPKANLTRAEMAQVLRNMDSVYYGLMGITSKTGVVSAIKNIDDTKINSTKSTRQVYVRLDDGSVDTLEYETNTSSSPQSYTRDAVTLKDGNVTGLSSLSAGDQIEYLVFGDTVIYVLVNSTEMTERNISGILEKIDFQTGKVTLRGESGKEHIFTMIKGMYDSTASEEYVIISNKKIKKADLPFSDTVTVKLKDNMIHLITHVGREVLIPEERGIVTENNPSFGYITYITNDGRKVTKNYQENDIRVEKQEYYDMEDEIGYIDEVFPDFRYDPRDTVISALEPGDIIFLRFSDDGTIENISASTNYIAKYGKVVTFSDESDYYHMQVMYDNQQLSWFDVPKDIFVSNDGKPAKTSDIQVGDYLKILVNQAIIEPGYVMESAKELTIEGNEHFITTVIKGQLSGINEIQEKFQIQNSQKLSDKGWSNYKEVEEFSLKGKNIEYYHNNTRISLDYALRYLKRSDGEVYVALENNYAGDNIKKVTFRDGRDELLSGEHILSTNPDGGFKVVSNDDYIGTDLGTIVIRNGRLVSGNDISPSDYATISLNNGNNAAVVNITGAPAYSGLMLVRGRVNSVDEGKTFRVQSISTLTGMEWVYSPIARDYSIDYDTIFITSDGVKSYEEFMDYGENSVSGKVFNIVVDGGRAAVISDSDYADEGLRGTITEITNNDDGLTRLQIKDVTTFSKSTGRWSSISQVNSYVYVDIPANSIIVKNNSVAYAKDLAVGNQIRVMTDYVPTNTAPGSTHNGLIIMVEKHTTDLNS